MLAQEWLILIWQGQQHPQEDSLGAHQCIPLVRSAAAYETFPGPSAHYRAASAGPQNLWEMHVLGSHPSYGFRNSRGAPPPQSVLYIRRCSGWFQCEDCKWPHSCHQTGIQHLSEPTSCWFASKLLRRGKFHSFAPPLTINSEHWLTSSWSSGPSLQEHSRLSRTAAAEYQQRGEKGAHVLTGKFHHLLAWLNNLRVLLQ